MYVQAHGDHHARPNRFASKPLATDLAAEEQAREGHRHDDARGRDDVAGVDDAAAGFVCVFVCVLVDGEVVLEIKDWEGRDGGHKKHTQVRRHVQAPSLPHAILKTF